jgi:hypothetical protein
MPPRLHQLRLAPGQQRGGVYGGADHGLKISASSH